MYEDLETKKADVESKLAGGDVGGETQRALLEQLTSLNKALKVEEVQDELWDEWEADIAAGRVPDLDKV